MFWDPGLFWQPPGTHCLSVVTSDVFSSNYGLLHVFPKRTLCTYCTGFFLPQLCKISPKKQALLRKHTFHLCDCMLVYCAAVGLEMLTVLVVRSTRKRVSLLQSSECQVCEEIKVKYLCLFIDHEGWFIQQCILFTTFLAPFAARIGESCWIYDWYDDAKKALGFIALGLYVQFEEEEEEEEEVHRAVFILWAFHSETLTVYVSFCTFLWWKFVVVRSRNSCRRRRRRRLLCQMTMST